MQNPYDDGQRVKSDAAENTGSMSDKKTFQFLTPTCRSFNRRVSIVENDSITKHEAGNIMDLKSITDTVENAIGARIAMWQKITKEQDRDQSPATTIQVVPQGLGSHRLRSLLSSER